MRVQAVTLLALAATLGVCRDSDANLPEAVQFMNEESKKGCPNKPTIIRGSEEQLNLRNDSTQSIVTAPEPGETTHGRQWCTPGTKTWVMIIDYNHRNGLNYSAPERFGTGNPAILDALMGAADLVDATLAKTNNGAVISQDEVIHWDRKGDTIYYAELGWQYMLPDPRVEIKVYNRQPYQITYGVLGAGLRGVRDFMRLSNGTTDGYIYFADGENVVGFASVVAAGDPPLE
ncbi:hypothetical protein ACLMJK_009423 [Lecanora helva]